MKKMISAIRIPLASTIIFTIAGIIYCVSATNIYIAKSHVAMFRQKIENPDVPSEESRNRWIWIRDGLNLKSALITDEILENMLKNNTLAKRTVLQHSSTSTMTNYLKSLINIQYTGADENNFMVEVKAPTPALALELNTIIFDRMKYLAVSADQINFKNVIEELKKRQAELSDNQGASSFYEDKIKKMTFTHLIEQKQRESSFVVISKPTVNRSPIWPDAKLIIAAAAFIGLAIGMGLDILLKLKRVKNDS